MLENAIDQPSEGYKQAGFDVDLNMYEMAAVATGSVLALNGLAVVASMAPAYAGVMLSGTGSLAYLGHRTRQGLPLNPLAKSEETKTEAKPESVPTPPAGGEVVELAS